MLSSDNCINVSVANVYREPTFKSEVVTQALLGETIITLGKEEQWYHIRLWDGYEGWINEFYTTRVDKEVSENIKSNETFIVDDLFGAVHEKPDSSTPIIRDLVFGNMLIVLDRKDGWSEVLLPDGEVGWTNSKHRSKPEGNIRDYLEKQAKRFLGVQYLWGGKSPKGFDCSGFVQTVMKSADILFPRDASMQENYSKLIDIEFEDIQKGDLFFFSIEKRGIDHVALSLGEKKFIHCSGFVKIESFDSHDPKYNERLYHRIRSVKSIQEFCR